MANTYTQIHIQFVFAVKFRARAIHLSWKEELYQYMIGIIHEYGHKVIAINGMPDHIHILIGVRPSQSISDLMKNVKQYSSKWINENKLVMGKFEWQEGYGAFAHDKSGFDKVIKYIQNQEVHHQKKKFAEEYLQLLERFEVDYDVRYVFKDPI